MLVRPRTLLLGDANEIVKVKEEKKEKEAAPLKSTPTKKKAKGKIDKSLISGPVCPSPHLIYCKLIK